MHIKNGRLRICVRICEHCVETLLGRIMTNEPTDLVVSTRGWAEAIVALSVDVVAAAVSPAIHSRI